MKAMSARPKPRATKTVRPLRRAPKATPASKNDAIGKRIIGATGTLLQRTSTHAISMSAIATAAKVGRQTLYRRFSNKDDVLHSVFEDRAFHNLEIMRKAVRWSDHVADIIVDTAVLTLDVTSRDRPMVQMLMEESSLDAGEFQVGPHSPMQRAATDLWRPILEAARERSALRKNLMIEEAILHVRSFHFILLIRRDIHPRQWPDYLKRYLLPVLLSDKANPYVP